MKASLRSVHLIEREMRDSIDALRLIHHALCDQETLGTIPQLFLDRIRALEDAIDELSPTDVIGDDDWR